jgi:hypothetical protein
MSESDTSADGYFNEIEAYDEVIEEMREKTRRLESTLQLFRENRDAMQTAAINIAVGQAHIAAFHKAANLLAHWHKECSAMKGKSWAEAFLEVEVTLRKEVEQIERKLADELATLRGLTDNIAKAEP